MVNYKRVVCEVAVLAVLVALAASAPARESHYDQRQNGTENYRLNIDGVVVAVVPAESFIAAASEIDIGDLLEEFNEIQKPKPPAESSPPKPEPTQTDVAKPEESKPDAGEKPEAPLSDVSLSPETKGQKKEAARKPVKGQRLKTLLANMLIPFMRRHEK